MTAFPLDDTYYLAQDMRLFHAGRTPGILNVTGNDFQVQANSGMNLTVKNGVAFTHTKEDEMGGLIFCPRQDVSLVAPVAEYYTRYDYVAIRYTQSSNQVQVVYVKGNAEMPSAPIRNQTQYDLILAIVIVPANAGEITQDNIMDVRMDEKFCGLTVDTLSKIPTQGFQDQWTAFFDTIKGILGEDEAGNLLYMIQANTSRILTNENNIEELTQNIDNVGSKLNSEISRATQKENELSSRMDTFTKLEQGSTTGDAELADIRVGFDGKTYENAGSAVRSQVSRLSSDIVDLGNGLNIYTTTPSWEQGNVTQNIEQDATDKIRTSFIDTKRATKLKTSIVDGYTLQILLYDKDKMYISNSNKSYKGDVERELDDSVFYIRMVIYRTTWGDIYPSDAEQYLKSISFYYPNGYATNEDLSKVKKAYIMLDFDYSYYVGDTKIGDGDSMSIREDLLKEYGFKGTLAVNYTAMSDEMQPIILANFKKYGWEYALYGYDGTGANYDTDVYPYISDDAYISDISAHLESYVSKMNSYGLYSPIVYFCRRNANGSALMKASKNNGIKLMRALTVDGNSIPKTYTENCIPSNMTLSTYETYYENFDWNDLKSKIDSHILNGGFMSIMTHRLWNDISKGSQTEDNTISNYRTILSYIKSLVDSGLVEVITWKDVYNIVHDKEETITKTDYERLLKRIELLES